MISEVCEGEAARTPYVIHLFEDKTLSVERNIEVSEITYMIMPSNQEIYAMLLRNIFPSNSSHLSRQIDVLPSAIS